MCTRLKQTQRVTKSTDTITNRDDINTHANRTSNTNQYKHKTRIKREIEKETKAERNINQVEKISQESPDTPHD